MLNKCRMTDKKQHYHTVFARELQEIQNTGKKTLICSYFSKNIIDSSRNKGVKSIYFDKTIPTKKTTGQIFFVLKTWWVQSDRNSCWTMTKHNKILVWQWQIHHDRAKLEGMLCWCSLSTDSIEWTHNKYCKYVKKFLTKNLSNNKIQWSKLHGILFDETYILWLMFAFRLGLHIRTFEKFFKPVWVRCSLFFS